MKHTVTPKDCKLDWFSGSGPGGQHRNKHQNCVRLFHAPSGVRKVGQSHKSQRENLLEAMTALSKDPQFRFWASEELKKREGGQSIQEAVIEQMRGAEIIPPDHPDYAKLWEAADNTP